MRKDMTGGIYGSLVAPLKCQMKGSAMYKPSNLKKTTVIWSQLRVYTGFKAVGILVIPMYVFVCMYVYVCVCMCLYGD